MSHVRYANPARGASTEVNALVCSMPDLTGAHRIVVTGRVQGVGFRYHTTVQARALQIAGWVQNQGDGTVEVVAKGPDPAIDALLRFLTVGPPGAHVTGVVAEDIDVAIDSDTFEIR